MKRSWSRLSTWAYDLPVRRRWVIWGVTAMLAVLVTGALPSPWSLVAALPFVVFGFVLFDAQARRQRDEDRARVSHRS